MNRFYCLIYILILVCYHNKASSQIPSRADSLRSDIRFLESSLKKSYPSLYRYQSRSKVDSFFLAEQNALTDSTTDIQFFGTVKRLLSTLKDGHLYGSAPAWLDTYLKEKARLFPLRLYFAGGKVWLQQLCGALPAATELLEIDSRPIAEVKKDLYQYVVGDGNITTKKDHILSNVFYFYYFLAYGERPQYQVKLRVPGGKITTTSISAVTENNIPPAIKTNDDPLLRLEITRSKVALMRITTFDRSAIGKAGLNFQDFLRTSFTRIRREKVNKLVIDLRNNGGGTDLYGALLYSYLAERPFAYYSQLTTATNQLPYDEFSSATSSYNNLNPSMLSKIGDGFKLNSKAHRNLLVQQPANYPYHGKIIFLINGLTFSTAAEFCAVSRLHKRGIFVGEETGGTSAGNTSGVEQEITLPNSQITCSFGLIRYQMAGSNANFGRGVIPDHIMLPEIQDLLASRDRALNFALEMFK